MASKRGRQTGEVLAIRLPLELDREIKAEAQRLRVRPCDLARYALAVGWAASKASGPPVGEMVQQGGNLCAKAI